MSDESHAKRRKLEDGTAAAGTDVPAAALAPAVAANLSNTISHQLQPKLEPESKMEEDTGRMDDATAPLPATRRAPSLSRQQSPASTRSAAAAAAPAATAAAAAAPVRSHSLAALLRDPAVRRVDLSYAHPARFQQRVRHNFALLGRLHDKLAPAQPPRPVKREEDESLQQLDDEKTGMKRQQSAELAEPPSAAVAARRAARQQQEAALLAGRNNNNSSKLPPTVSTTATAPSVVLNPAAAAKDAALARRRKKRRNLDPLAHQRPSSCPPIIVHPPVDSAAAEKKMKDKWPQWFVDIASPRAKDEPEPLPSFPPMVVAAAAMMPGSTPPPPGSAQQSRRRLPPRFSYEIPPAALSLSSEALKDAAAASSSAASLVTPVKQEATGTGGWMADVASSTTPLLRPAMQRSATAQPHAISWLSASAPSTPAIGGYRELALQSPGFGAAAALAAAHHHTYATSTSSASTLVPVDGLANALFAAAGGQSSSSSSDRRHSGMFSPSLTSGSAATGATGSRPTPLLLPATSPTASATMPSLMSPASRPLSRAAGSPRFGDSVLVTSILSNTGSSSSSMAPNTAAPPLQPIAESMAAPPLQRNFSLMSPVHRASHPTPQMVGAAWPAHAVPPMSPLMRQPSMSIGAVGGAAGALLQEWRLLGAAFVESVLHPPTKTALASATRLPVQTHAAALSRFQQNTNESNLIIMPAPATPQHHSKMGTPAHTAAAAAAAGSMPPPMSPLPGRRASITGAHFPLVPPPHSPSMLRALSEQSLMRTPPMQGGGGFPGSGLPPIPSSPSIARMASFHHHTPTMTPARAAGAAAATPQQQHHHLHHSPMSPLGLAQPAPGEAMLSPLIRHVSANNNAVPAGTAAVDIAMAGAAAELVELPAAALVPHTSSRVGSQYQAEPPPMLTQKQREWERSVYLHAHAAVHGFPRHLPPLPSQPTMPLAAPSLTHQNSTGSTPPAAAAASASAALPTYVPVPRIFPPPYALPGFPASASLLLTSKRTALREKLMGGRKAARRKEEMRRRAEESGFGRRSVRGAAASAAVGGGGGGGGSSSGNGANGLDRAAIDAWVAELEESAREVEARHGRNARKKNRDTRRADSTSQLFASDTAEQAEARRQPFRSAHPSFTSFASLFPADSPFARMKFDDDTLSPYFVCSAFVRPPSPLSDPRRSHSPVHVLSVPPTPSAGPLARRLPDLSRFPSSLLEPSMFNRRMAALADPTAAALHNALEQQQQDDDDEAEAEASRAREKELIALELRRARALQAASMEEDVGMGGGDMSFAHDQSLRQQHPHVSARLVNKPAPRQAVAPRAAPGSASKGKRKTPSSATPSSSGPSASPSPPVVLGAPVAGVVAGDGGGGVGGRYKRWKMVAGKRIVWWVDSAGNTLDADQVRDLVPSSEEQKQQPSASPQPSPLPAVVVARAVQPTARQAARKVGGGPPVGRPSPSPAATAASVVRPSQMATKRVRTARREFGDHELDDAASDDAGVGAAAGPRASDDEEESGSRNGSGAAMSDGEESHASSTSSGPRSILIKRSVLKQPATAAYLYEVNSQQQPAGGARTASRAPAAAAAAGAPSTAPLRQNLSDLSPAVRVSAARSGVQRCLARIDEACAAVQADDGDEMDDSMERAVGVWREQKGASMLTHA